MNKSKNVINNLGHVAAFIADSDAIASAFVGIINAETDGKVLSLTKTYDGYWISIDDGHPKIASLVLDLGRETFGIKVGGVLPSKEKLVGEEVFGFEDVGGRCLIQMLTGIPEAKQPTLAEAIACIEKHISSISAEIVELSWEVNNTNHHPLVVSNMKASIEMDHHEHACLCFTLAKLKGEEEYAAKMLDGAHARMELARQMNEQGEL